jgi:hypothetical protein
MPSKVQKIMILQQFDKNNEKFNKLKYKIKIKSEIKTSN